MYPRCKPLIGNTREEWLFGREKNTRIYFCSYSAYTYATPASSKLDENEIEKDQNKENEKITSNGTAVKDNHLLRNSSTSSGGKYPGMLKRVDPSWSENSSIFVLQNSSTSSVGKYPRVCENVLIQVDPDFFIDRYGTFVNTIIWYMVLGIYAQRTRSEFIWNFLNRAPLFKHIFDRSNDSHPAASKGLVQVDPSFSSWKTKIIMQEHWYLMIINVASI